MDKKKFQIILPYIKILKEKFKPQKIILFGSRARGDNHKESDYDLLIVAEKFKNINIYERSVAAYHLKRNVPAAMDIICLTPAEFEKRKKEIGIINEAVKEGVMI